MRWINGRAPDQDSAGLGSNGALPPPPAPGDLCQLLGGLQQKMAQTGWQRYNKDKNQKIQIGRTIFISYDYKGLQTTNWPSTLRGILMITLEQARNVAEDKHNQDGEEGEHG